MQPHERIGGDPVPAGPVVAVDDDDGRGGLADQGVDERHRGGARPDDQVVGLDSPHGVLPVEMLSVPGSAVDEPAQPHGQRAVRTAGTRPAMPMAALRNGRRARGRVASRVSRSVSATTCRRSGAGRRCSRRARCPGRREHGGQGVGQGDRVLDAEVHALPAGRAVHVRGVAREQQPPGAVGVGDAVVDPEPRAPDHVGDVDAARAEPAVVEQLLHERRGRVLGCVVDAARRCGRCRRAAAPPPSGPRSAQNRMTSSVGRVAAQPDVGQHERLAVRAAREADAGLLAHGAVHAVGADHVPGPHGVAVVERRPSRRRRPGRRWRAPCGRTRRRRARRSRSSSTRSVVDCGTISV